MALLTTFIQRGVRTVTEDSGCLENLSHWRGHWGTPLCSPQRLLTLPSWQVLYNSDPTPSTNGKRHAGRKGVHSGKERNQAQMRIKI